MLYNNQNNKQIIIKNLGIMNYQDTLTMMQNFTLNRTPDTLDEIWVLEHYPVFTLGLAANVSHILNASHNIPIIKSDRGGQVTYHANGQLIIYLLLNLKKLDYSIRELVIRIENSIINYLLKSFNIQAYSNRAAPGVYVANKKIASLGLKVKNSYIYHGLSFNINMDLTPFSWINVCGYSNLQVTQLKDLLLEQQYNVTDELLLAQMPQNLNLNVIATDVVQSLVHQLYSSN